MTTKQRNKNNIIAKNSHSNQDDVAKKASEGGEAKGSGSGGWVRVLAVLCYIVLVAAAGLAALYFQRVLEEMSQINRRTEESVQKNAELASRLESVLQQVDSLRGTVEGFEPAVAIMRAELDDVGGALRRGDAEARRAEDALRELQRELLQHLSRGMQEAEEVRGRDSAEQERLLEERLGELTRSIGDSVAQIRGEQGHAQVQIGDLRARLDTAPLKQELLDVGAAVAELRAASQRAETSTESLRDRIGSLDAELHTANQKAASAVREVESVRALVQNTAGAMEKSMSAVETSIQALTGRAQSLQAGLEQAHSSIQSVAEGQRGAEAQGVALGEEVGARLRAVGARLRAAEETVDALRASEAVQKARLDSQESALAVLGGDLRSARSAGEAEVTAVQAALREAAQAHLALAGQVEALESDVGKLWSAAAILNSTQIEQSLRDSSMNLQLEGLGQELGGLSQELGGLSQKLEGQSQEVAAMGEALTEAQALNILKASVAQKNLRKLMTTVDSLLSFSNRVKGHVDAIASLQSALEETNASVSIISKKYKVSGGNV